jgi:hypothetical protein
MDMQYEGQQMLQNPQMMQMPPNIMTQQMMPQQMMQNPQMMPQMQQTHYGDMGSLARDITDNLDDIPNQNTQQLNHRYANNIVNDQNQHRNIPKKTGIVDKIPFLFREPLIIVVVYVILSLDIVKQTLGSYIPQIKPNAGGNVQFIGYIIYGMIMAIAIMTMKRLLL